MHATVKKIDCLEVISISRRIGRPNKTWIETVGNEHKALNLTDKLLWSGLNVNVRFRVTGP